MIQVGGTKSLQGLLLKDRLYIEQAKNAPEEFNVFDIAKVDRWGLPHVVGLCVPLLQVQKQCRLYLENTNEE